MSKNTLTNLPDIQSLVTLVIKICKKLGLNDIKSINESILTATEDSALGHRDLKIICTLSELGGKVELIKTQLKDCIKENDEIIVVSSHGKKISKYFQDWLKSELKTDKILFWEESYLIELVDKHLPEYWGHNDVFLKSFEDAFIERLESNGELQKVLQLDEKFEELLNFFIEPKIYHIKEDEKTGRQVHSRFNKDKYLDGNNYFISGDAGTGKTTLLKEIGKIAIQHNQNSTYKILPIKIKTTLIANSGYLIDKAIRSEIINLVGEEGVDKVFNDYKVLLLIDSIDELERPKQREIFEDLKELTGNKKLSFILATRNYESLTKGCEICNHINTLLSNFDLNQVQRYLTTFFKRDLKKSEELWLNLQENKILDKIPPTPLTISLVSILFEENGYEVPATITDVYDNFNTFLLGRLNVNSSLDFLKIDVKEKILQMYALKIIKSQNRVRLKEDDFVKYIKDYFREQSITIEEGTIPELIKGLTDGTGVLYLDDLKYVTYQHDHFMEYYASREIFNDENRNKLENEIVENFCKYNWQNTAIFYAGRTKNMKMFLKKLALRTEQYTSLPNILLSISGLGYILQSLWMTNSENRKEAILTALNLLIRADAKVKELAEKGYPFFKGIGDFDIAIINLFWFYTHYNSLTLRDPLQLAFDELHDSLKQFDNTQFEKDKTTRLYQLFCIAATLNTGRVKDNSKLETLFDQDKLLTNSLFVFLFNEAIDLLELGDKSQLRREYKIDTKKRKYIHSIRFYLDHPSKTLNNTTYELLNPIKEVEIFTEGKTDASIIKHSFNVLTMGREPYWSITAIEDGEGAKAGGAHQLTKYLTRLANNIKTDFDKKKTIIGIFDNDEKGYSEFNGLPDNFKMVNGILKKVEGLNIYAMLLPIPDSQNYEPYHQEKQAFKFFEIEHYFPLNFLQDNNMVKETSIPSVYEIIGDKSNFKDKVIKSNKPELFTELISLFNEIDKVCEKEINYIDSK
ncbi:NACHT domain-containing protein [Sinomicrobium weinanense]|uniref:NACHT domain-containing protein n=1 Tax=Sinomicrobium weinanense TaxID=2842200 RepID=A0A926JW29_9FLAO|nr:NACHT domain-containing protein [Sinomicrobium weinanense]MBC9798243.1 NACHT domain-containing protein [Sinomicrobium weinanense]MBU3123253.1 NACHT domain-containing protein [Sinomicrobium weinanense]